MVNQGRVSFPEANSCSRILAINVTTLSGLGQISRVKVEQHEVFISSQGTMIIRQGMKTTDSTNTGVTKSMMHLLLLLSVLTAGKAILA